MCTCSIFFINLNNISWKNYFLERKTTWGHNYKTKCSRTKHFSQLKGKVLPKKNVIHHPFWKDPSKQKT
jgi:hypothetical protein